MLPTHISILPPETLLLVVSYLSWRDVSNLRAVSRWWHELILENEETVFHQLSLYHGMISSTTCGLAQASMSLPALRRHVSSWKEFFAQNFMNEYAWVSDKHTDIELTAFETQFEEGRYPVHRFKIDEKENTVISTSLDGGLVVRDLDTRELLFALPQSTVQSFAHVEFSNGFVVFNREGDELEVWRRRNDAFADAEHQALAQPDELQIIALKKADYRTEDGTLSESERYRGHLVPYAVLRQQEATRAYRLVYPTLLLASAVGERAFLWDVPSSSLAQTIDTSNPFGKLLHGFQDPDDEEINRVNYVELSEKYIFVCTERKLLVFTREPMEKGESPLVLAFPNEANTELEGSLLYCDRSSYSEPEEFSSWVTKCEGRRAAFTNDMLKPVVENHNHFVAAHVSEDGKDLVAISEHGCLYYIDNFERLIQPESVASSTSSQREKEVVWFYQFRPIVTAHPAFNLAFEKGRIAMTCGDGIFIFTLSKPNHLFYPSPSPPQEYDMELDPFEETTPARFISMQTLIHFIHPQALRFTTWSALSGDSFWTTWHPVIWNGVFAGFLEPTLVRVKML